MLSFLINAVLHIPLVFYTCPDHAILDSLTCVFTLDFAIISFILNVSLLIPITHVSLHYLYNKILMLIFPVISSVSVFTE